MLADAERGAEAAQKLGQDSNKHAADGKVRMRWALIFTRPFLAIISVWHVVRQLALKAQTLFLRWHVAQNATPVALEPSS
jgi:hypothetical protein